jgi:hypothetical protein
MWVQPVDGPSLPWPVAASAPSCGAIVQTGVTTGPAQCSQPVTSYLLVRYPARPRAVWPVFFCAAHAGEVPVAEPLDRVAAAELADRREQHALAMTGKPYRAPVPLQLNPGR